MNNVSENETITKMVTNLNTLPNISAVRVSGDKQEIMRNRDKEWLVAINDYLPDTLKLEYNENTQLCEYVQQLFDKVDVKEKKPSQFGMRRLDM